MHARRIPAEYLLLATCVFEGLFPAIARIGSSAFPPVLFVSLSAACAAAVLAVITTLRGHFRTTIPRRAFAYIAVVALCIIGGFAIIVSAARFTSGINITLLLQAEMLFAFLYCNVLMGETITRRLVAGMVLIFMGACGVLFNGTFAVNPADMFVLFATALFPIGNIFAKKALALVPPTIVLLFRYIFGCILLFPVSFLLGEYGEFDPQVLVSHGWIIVLYAVGILILSKLFWYRALLVLPVGKASQIIGATPVLGFFFSLVFLREAPTAYQLLGLVATVIGVYLLMSRRHASAMEVDLV